MIETLRFCFDTNDWAVCLADKMGISIWLFCALFIAGLAVFLRLILGKPRKDDHIGPFDGPFQ